MAKSRGRIFLKPENIKPEISDGYNDPHKLKTKIRIMLGINFDITNKCDIFIAIKKIWTDVGVGKRFERFSKFLDTVEIFVTREYFRELLTSSCVSNGLNYQPLLYQCFDNPGLLSKEFEYLLHKMREYEIKSIEVNNEVNNYNFEDIEIEDDDEWGVDKQIMIQYIENHDAEIDARDRERSLIRRIGKKKEGSQIYTVLNKIMGTRKGKTLDELTIKAIVDERYTSPPKKGKAKKKSKTAERTRRKKAWEKREKEKRKREELIKKTRRKVVTAKPSSGSNNGKAKGKAKTKGKAKAKSKSKSRSKSNSKGKAKKGGKRKTKRRVRKKIN